MTQVVLLCASSGISTKSLYCNSPNFHQLFYRQSFFYMLFIGKNTIEFSQLSYNVNESSGYLTVTLVLTKGVSDNDITVTVTPSDQSPVSAEGKKCVYPTMTS